jgi:glycosyltransferase involved in cell wall biosynthesis
MSEQQVLSQVSLKGIKNIISVGSLFYNGTRYANKIAKEKKIDVFICLWIVPSGLMVLLKNIFFSKTPYILWALGSDVNNNKDNFFTKTLLRLIIKQAKAVFADGIELCETVNKISGRTCEFLPTFHKMQLQEKFFEEKNSFMGELTFLYVGRLVPVKGVDVLIEAFKLLKKENGRLNFKCNIIGDGDQMPMLISEINTNGLKNNVFLLGRVMDENLFADYFKNAYCVIIPSRSESIPVVLSEAVQFGKPVITTNAGDMEYIVKKYNLGLVAKKENPEDLANAIKLFIEKPLKLNKIDRDNLLKMLIFDKNADKLLTALK